jgi:hypothetical protein
VRSLPPPLPSVDHLMVEQRPLSIGVKNGEDHVLLIDPGPADKSEMAMQSIDENFSGFSAKSPL